MTNEEFYGHLMAALSGPHAPEIVARIVTVAMMQAESDPIASAIEEILDAALGDIHESVQELQLLAHLEGVKGFGAGRRLTTRETMEATSARVQLRGLVSQRLAARLRHLEGGPDLAAKMFLDLESEE